MGVTATFRYKLGDQETARKWGKIACEIWAKNGATSTRAFLVMAGPNVGNWIFAFDFPDLATYGKGRVAVRATPEFDQWTAANAKVGNVLLDAGLFEDLPL